MSEERADYSTEQEPAEGYATIEPAFPDLGRAFDDEPQRFTVQNVDGTAGSFTARMSGPGLLRVSWERGRTSGQFIARWAEVLPAAMDRICGRNRWRLREYQPNRAPAQLGIEPGPTLISPGRHDR